jgi:hypothetical protein
MTLFQRCVHVTRHILSQLEVAETLDESCLLHQRIQKRQEMVEKQTKAFVSTCMISFAVVIVWAICGAFTFRPVKIFILLLVLVVFGIALSRFSQMNVFDAKFVQAVGETFRETDRYYRVYGAVKLLKLHPLQYDVLGIAITPNLLAGYVASCVVTMKGQQQPRSTAASELQRRHHRVRCPHHRSLGLPPPMP